MLKLFFVCVCELVGLERGRKREMVCRIQQIEEEKQKKTATFAFNHVCWAFYSFGICLMRLYILCLCAKLLFLSFAFSAVEIWMRHESNDSVSMYL